MSPNARAFMAANKESPVVSGYALESDPRMPAKGVSYTLDDDRTFRLTPAECADVGVPRWAFD